jgi:asparagine N-glycosylation enzyme membrane subunit Stt3
MGLFRRSGLPEVKIGWLDLKLVSLCGVFVGLILALLIPALLEISLWWYVVLGALCLVRVWYVLLKK